MITPARPMNETTMPTTSFGVLFLDIGHAGPLAAFGYGRLGGAASERWAINLDGLGIRSCEGRVRPTAAIWEHRLSVGTRRCAHRRLRLRSRPASSTRRNRRDAGRGARAGVLCGYSHRFRMMQVGQAGERAVHT